VANWCRGNGLVLGWISARLVPGHSRVHIADACPTEHEATDAPADRHSMVDTQIFGEHDDAMAPSEAFAEFGRVKLADHSLEDILEKLATLVRRTIPGAAEVSVTLLTGGHATTAAYTGGLALSLDERQYDLGSGPCLDAASSSTTLHIRDMTTEDRWPDFAARAVKEGALSSLSVPVPVQDRTSAALNIYATSAHAYDNKSIRVAQTFASYAAVAISNVHLYTSTAALAAQLQEAMHSRAVIEQAKGILMAVHRSNANAAFALLTKESQHTNRKLRDVAADIVARAGGQL
jgi:GAF domain-containing protein